MVKVKVYSRDYCPYCVKAKMLLKKLNQDFEEVHVDDKVMDDLIVKTGWRTVPQIFIDDKFIGGCDDIFKLYEEGKLNKLLSD
ncbi:MAG: glutathione S-transferase N-terminal domain-containing protein [Nanoarchaeota archaeon]|nr:glutathione S-transferase N-terminal domain-containing protein [Nanoarchaeota archaeon]